MVLETFETLNMTSNDTDAAGDAVATKVIKTFCYSVIMLMSLVGNTLVIAIIFRNRRMRTTTNNFIANMAMSDLLFPLFAVPRETVQILTETHAWLIHGVGGNILCKIVSFSQDISTAVSILSLVFIAFDRFYAIKFPLKPSLITPKSCRIIICLIWVVAMGIHSPYFYGFRLDTISNSTYCILTWEPAFETVSTQKVYFLIIFVVLIIFPIALITILYTAIGVEVWMHKGPVERSNRERQKREYENRKVLKQVVTVVAVFISCIFPVTVYGCLSHFVWELTDPPAHIDWFTFKFCAFFILHSNAAITPCIYFIFNKNYRRGLKEMFYCCAQLVNGYRLSKQPENSPPQTGVDCRT